jgi:hypothetical protein
MKFITLNLVILTMINSLGLKRRAKTHDLNDFVYMLQNTFDSPEEDSMVGFMLDKQIIPWLSPFTKKAKAFKYIPFKNIKNLIFNSEHEFTKLEVFSICSDETKVLRVYYPDDQDMDVVDKMIEIIKAEVVKNISPLTKIVAEMRLSFQLMKDTREFERLFTDKLEMEKRVNNLESEINKKLTYNTGLISSKVIFTPS